MTVRGDWPATLVGRHIRIGAPFEGVHRRKHRRADGSWQDSAYFSLLVDE
ncbi:hypothetical protein ACFVVX_03665 [Kitasatospora sp. NPDC058170]